MAEHDALIGAYEHLDRLPRAADALQLLRKVASLVKPIMRKRGWHVGLLTEFYPSQANLLGLNVNRGQKICLRLRYPRDQSLFLPIEQVVDTMLHELSHIVHGPHDQKFHALWNALRDEHEELIRKGYSGEGFLSQGRRLGGRGMPIHEMRRQARAAAERRNTLTKNSGQKLGGTTVPRNIDIRAVIADAATRRTRQTQGITQGCASGSKEAEGMAEQASRNGFRTKAEEDEANDRAIAQALWELIQEEEARNAGLADDSWRTDGLTWDPTTGLQPSSPPPPYEQFPAPARPSRQPERTDQVTTPPVPTHSRPSARPPQQQRPRVTFDEASTRPASAPASAPKKRPLSSSNDQGARPVSRPSAPASAPTTWPCEVCTLVNPITYLCCDACGSQRPPQYNVSPSSSSGPRSQSRSSTATSMTGQTRSGTGNLLPAGENALRTAQVQKLGWNCLRCGTFMENQWWTCSLCGSMKASS